jgi:hypothetical protein
MLVIVKKLVTDFKRICIFVVISRIVASQYLEKLAEEPAPFDTCHSLHVCECSDVG